ncbi:MAG: hypothetical protein O7C67_16805 [Gammaproteobacteria bacterium]|nr:hypothetical protein [Gammaproteobacteria bacterium]
MNLDLANVRDADLAHISADGTSLAEVHVALNRHLARQTEHERSILVDLRNVTIDASSSEVPVFIDFLKFELIPALRARSASLVILADQTSAATPLGSVITALSNLNEFADDVVIASTFEAAYRSLEKPSGELHA